METRRSKGRTMAFAAGVAILVSICGSIPALKQPTTGVPQLVSVRQLSGYGEMCQWPESDPNTFAAPRQENLFAALRRPVLAAPENGDIARPPIRTIRDMDPIYSSVAVDTRFDEVILQDNNMWSIRVFNRLDNTAPGAPYTEPKRVIQGPETEVQFNNGLHIDPKNGDIYSVETDTGDKVVVFPRDAKGNIKPARILHTPHRGFALAVDEEKQELFVGVQYPPEVAVFRKGASGDDKPLRSLQGESTRLSDVHGVAIDPKNKLLFVTNWGHVSDYRTSGTGRFEDPSISVYPLGADGDTAPLRVIQGSKTQMNWPAQMSIDPDTGDLYVANDIGHSVLVFKGTDQGNVAPARVIQGKRTGLLNPSGVFVDKKNNELWVSNFGNSSASVFPLTANGDVAPLRTIRSAPSNKVSLKFGKVEALAYDARRDQVWVPN